MDHLMRLWWIWPLILLIGAVQFVLQILIINAYTEPPRK
jgi:hypothetical protein